MDDKTLVEQLRLEAQNVSEASKLMAQAKSRRQGDGPPRDDLYSWAKPEQTIQWKAATRIEALEAALRSVAETCREEIPLPYVGKMREVLLRNLAEWCEQALESSDA